MAVAIRNVPAHLHPSAANVVDALDDAAESLRAQADIAHALALSGIDSPEALVELSRMAASCESAIAPARRLIVGEARRSQEAKAACACPNMQTYALLSI